MRILFLVPTTQHKSTAGSRIRYDRIRAKSEYFDVAVQSLDEVSREDLAACDVCVFSKTYSVGAVAVAEALRARGVVVGIDLFDDYFSQEDDPRLTPFRSWLRRFAPVFQFGLCSTPTMRRVIGHLAPDLPVHIVPDPCPEIDPATVTRSVRRSLERARKTGTLDVLWFGIGANPFFPVGLQDLVAHAWSLSELAAGRYRVALRVLTDDASQNPGNLVRLKSLPVPFVTETWTVEREQQALEEALVAFIPVNGQSFSRAKSPNRALTAIAAGAQVLSPGYPLYGDLDALIYARAADLLADIEQGECRVSPGRIGEIQRVVASVSDLDDILAELFLFLTRQSRARPRVAAPAGTAATGALLYGIDPERHTTHALPAADVVSVKTPYARIERVYDVRLDLRDERQLDLWLRPEMVRYLAEPLRARLSASQPVGKIRMVRLEGAAELRLDRPLAVPPSETRDVVYETAAYRTALADLAGAFRRAFPSLGVRVAGLSAYQGAAPARDGAY
ncbi:hypothetical protein [Methylobacterium oryzihabitans]|uniref:Glycosyltransferase n=1 Tax=Methylobacterium oryzihabitans TaxID=2499852 RepID=A0A437NZY5_9HYPH|nr:hypothetical protein [Methylobacterium oryzihabitans]RVU15601.1 hypothetical protein EOE48_18985 [Methylobacterium oryzihabitans]